MAASAEFRTEMRRAGGNVGFVCVVNGARDRYEVPLALSEAGLLENLVTDYYAADQRASWLPGALARRRRDGLPQSRTRSIFASLLVQQIGERMPLPIHAVHGLTDRLLANAGLAEACRHSADLYCYSSYLPARRPARFKGRIVDFEYHPRPELAVELLAVDVARFPEAAQSFALEQRQLGLERQRQGWRIADAVVCASSFTRRSLEHSGCDPARIAVVPYGIAPPATDPAARPLGACRFLFAGQGMQRKGLHHLIRAWRDRAPDDSELTVMCYRIDPGIRALGEGTNIRFLGRQSPEALTQLYRAADVFVMPSLVEGFGLAYLEALREGCHLIGTANTGLPDLPLSQAAATIVPAGDLDALRRALDAAAERKHAGSLDPAAIVSEALAWTWSDFRRKIATHAAGQLSGQSG